ncbi:MAG: DNA polymerase ligase N-terminal domain-containing protein [Planctomycetaceae bacterium]|nr:DNA polymerase ligase N-terminal domain-containing protein [Planctomycetaceae bacterium]
MTSRFVILTHDHPHLHWDLMLEQETSLRTWRLNEDPNNSGPITAEELSNHRKHYLDYEGPVSGNRGTIVRWDMGTYETVADSEYQLEIKLAGEKIHSQAVLSRNPQNDCWEFQLIDRTSPST